MKQDLRIAAGASGARLASLDGRRGNWWETPQFALIATLIMTVPLLWPAIPPLVDVPGHLGRYHVALEISRSPFLQQHWIYRWRLIGNLGVDLAVMPLARLVGLELATKLVVLAIPPLFALGLFRLSRAADGRISPLLPMALPIAYGFPFQFGFINFMFAATLALNALPGWIRMGRQGRFALRSAIFVPASILIWVAHSFGWGMLGLFAFAAEIVRLRQLGRTYLRALLAAALHCLPMAIPAVWMAASGGASSGGVGIEYGWSLKPFWLISILKERWMTYDEICAALLLGVLILVVWRRRSFRFQPVLGAIALAACMAFLLLPRLLLDGAFVDARMAGFAVALALAAVRLEPERQGQTTATLATGFFILRMLTTTVVLLGFSEVQAQALAAVDRLPRGAGVMVIVNEPCGVWSTDRLEHVDGIAIERRDAFTNGQWAIGGQQLIAPKHPEADPYRADPSQLAYPRSCERHTIDPQKAISQFDRGTFHYLWLMDFAPVLRPAPDLKRIWANERSQVYEVSKAR